MPDFFDYLVGVPLFAVYFLTALLMTFVYVLIYTKITPHNEITLIKDNKPAAAIAMVGSLLGFVIPLASAIANSQNLLDMVLWGSIALIVQVLTFFFLRIFFPKISQRIANNELASGIWLGAISLAVGILNAACMTY